MISITGLPEAPGIVMELLTPEEIDRIIESIDRKSPTGVRNHAIFVTLLDSGLRASEVTNITLGNLNLKDGATSWHLKSWPAWRI